MKKLVCEIVVCLFLCGLVSAQESPQSSDTRKITVTGEAEVQVVPDKVVILMGIETWNKEIQLAKQQNNNILRQAREVIKKTGVKEKDVKTDHLSIEPRYESEYRRENFIGFFVRNSISVTLNDTGNIEQLITGVLTAGVTHIHGIDFQTTEFKKYRQEARKLALLAAKEKAENMAAVLDKKIGYPIQINENSQYNAWYYNGGWGNGRNQGVMSQMVMQAPSGPIGDVSETLSLGMISVRGNVTVTFELQ